MRGPIRLSGVDIEAEFDLETNPDLRSDPLNCIISNVSSSVAPARAAPTEKKRVIHIFILQCTPGQ